MKIDNSDVSKKWLEQARSLDANGRRQITDDQIADMLKRDPDNSDFSTNYDVMKRKANNNPDVARTYLNYLVYGDAEYDTKQKEKTRSIALPSLGNAIDPVQPKPKERGWLEPYKAEDLSKDPNLLNGIGGALANSVKSIARLAIEVPKGLGKTALGLGVKAVEGVAGKDLFNDPLGSESTVEGIGKAVVGGAKNTVETAAFPIAKAINYAFGTDLDSEKIFNDPETEGVASAVGQYFADRTGVVDFLKYLGSAATFDTDNATIHLNSALSKLSKTAYEDPAGLLSDFMTVAAVAGGALKLAGKAGQFGTRLATAGAESVDLTSKAAKFGKIAENVERAGTSIGKTALELDPAYRILKAEGQAAGAVVKGAAKATGYVRDYAEAQLTGLKPQTIKDLRSIPEKMQAGLKQGLNREGLADQFQAAVQKGLDEADDTGKAYKAIREGAGTVSVPRTNIESTLQQYGMKFDWDKGELIRTAESIPMEPGDVRALQSFLNDIGKNEQLSGNAFLNVRKSLSNMARFAEDKSDSSTIVAKALRKMYDTAGKEQLSGLKELDAKYAPLRSFFGDLQDSYLTTTVNADGKTQTILRPTAISKIMNAKPQEIQRLTSIVPSLQDDIRVIKALEDVELAGGQKVGTYVRGAVGGAGVIAGASGNLPVAIPAAMVSILSEPHIFFNMVTKYGILKNTAKGFINGLIDAVKGGRPLTDVQKKFAADAINHFDDLDSGSTAENRLAKLKGMNEGTPGIDFASPPPAIDVTKLKIPDAGDAAAVFEHSTKLLGASQDELTNIVKAAGNNTPAIQAALEKLPGWNKVLPALEKAVDDGTLPMGALDIADPLRRAVFGAAMSS